MITTIDDGRPKTTEQFFALPAGPAFGFEVHELTDEDRTNRFIMVRGERVGVSGNVQKLSIPVVPEVMVVDYSAEEPLMWRDDDGLYWMLGRYRDGRWFRKRS